jgi:hypothetical protein
MGRNPDLDKEPAEGSRETINDALRHRTRSQPGITNRSVQDEQREQRKLPPRVADGEADESTLWRETATPESQSSGGKTGLRSEARRHASARRGDKPPGKARAKAGASGWADRRPDDKARAKRGVRRAAGAARRSRRKG